ncbi:hypothetical protein [Amycolatopsis sp. cmx-11-12]|uniref:hypothetical protein n=1 Tax=Amycolatopsis sp. cmx-11-12 TaxID=2785795 RepID=UPI003916EB70
MSSPVEEQAVPSEHQRRRRRWVAEHAGVLTVASAAVFGAMGVLYGSWTDADVSWLNPVVAGVIGVVFGGLLGYGASTEARESQPKGVRRVVVIVGAVLCAAVVLGMWYLRHQTLY